MTAHPAAPQRDGQAASSRRGAWAVHDGGFVPAHEVVLAPTTQALNYGTGVFEGIRAYRQSDQAGSALFRAADHYQRFCASAAVLRIDVRDDVAGLVERTVELVRRNGAEHDTYVRPLAYKVALEPGTRFGVRLTDVSSSVAITTVRMGGYMPAEGLRCAVSTWRRTPSVSLPATAKVTGGYANNALAVDEAHRAGFDDALMLNVAGTVAEASTANIFVLNGGELATPSVGCDILPGITRATVMELAAAELGLRTVERAVSRAELYAADEVFLTGTGVEVAPVVDVDGRRIGAGTPGPTTTALRTAYEQVVRGVRAEYASWLTPIGI